MTAYADLDTSVIDELPPGRTPVTTVAIPDTRRADIIQRVKSACLEEGRQAYCVYADRRIRTAGSAGGGSHRKN